MLNLFIIVRVKMAMGNSAKQEWASLNKHFFSITSLFVDFYCNVYMKAGEIQQI